jgi:glucokinase
VSAPAWIGLDVGGTKILGVAVDRRSEIVARARVATHGEDGPEAVLGRCVALVRELASDRDPAGVGVGFAGLVDARAGSVSSSIMLPGWERFPLGPRLAAAVCAPCRVENDANAAGYGEWIALGSPRELALVVLTVGTGIGGALLLGGRLHRGASGVAGEIGNMSIDWNGPECWCGSRGCLNMLASGSALAARHAELTRGPARSVEELGRRALAGDDVARRVLDDGARALGAGIANVINLINPERVALAGGVAELGDGWLTRVRDEARRRAFRESMDAVTIERCRLGETTGALGAAALARAELGEA